MTIDDLFTVPYKLHGRTMEGMDCYGLAIEVERRLGHELWDVLDNRHNSDLCVKRESLNAKQCKAPSEGVLVELYLDNHLHIGVCLNAFDFIHMTKDGVRVSKLAHFKVRAFYEVQEHPNGAYI